MADIQKYIYQSLTEWINVGCQTGIIWIDIMTKIQTLDFEWHGQEKWSSNIPLKSNFAFRYWLAVVENATSLYISACTGNTLPKFLKSMTVSNGERGYHSEYLISDLPNQFWYYVHNTVGVEKTVNTSKAQSLDGIAKIFSNMHETIALLLLLLLINCRNLEAKTNFKDNWLMNRESSLHRVYHFRLP